MTIRISKKIEDKLIGKHDVTPREVEQCFENAIGGFIEETREQHKTDPATLWFIAPTNQNRLLKIVFVPRDDGLYIRTAYPPNTDEIDIYLNKIK
jgi:hypothetical protein